MKEGITQWLQTRKPNEKHTSKMHIYEIAKKRVQQAQQILACKPKYAIGTQLRIECGKNECDHNLWALLNCNTQSRFVDDEFQWVAAASVKFKLCNGVHCNNFSKLQVLTQHSCVGSCCPMG